MSDDKIFQYFPFKSHVHPSFWHKLAEIKIDVDGLSDKEKNIFGYYTNANTKNCLLQTDYSAFNSAFNVPRDSFKSHGLLLNKNTIEEFKNCNKKEILEQASTKFWQNIQNGNCIKDPSLLVFFLVLSFADLKKFNYYYWFAFPVYSQLVVYKCSDPAFINTVINAKHLDLLNREYFAHTSNAPFFILETTDSGIQINALQDKISAADKEANFSDADLETTYFCFADPCEFVNAGWVLRNFIVFLVHWCPKLRSKKIKVISVRIAKASLIESSLIYEIIMPETDIDVANMKWIGWERNEQGNYGPKVANMANSMDPIKQAENSVNLNLKLMKWRLLPSLNLEIIAKTRCLLIGAGTLGCGVARSLMAWGCNTISFIDGGNVSHSNPVRQYLYTHKDAVEKLPKALAAERRVKEIHPGITSKGYTFDIPMPGHPVGASQKSKTIESIENLARLIETHDVIFLLTDSRESRWLPTLLGVFHEKIVITAALGFDSYLILRHGCRKETSASISVTEIEGLKCIKGNELGCYFCNDITAPGNSMKDRTLDQQCTVTRPAVSNIASSLAVELMVSLLQHKDQALAPAYSQRSHGSVNIPEGLLGILPHSIRGSLSVYEQILPATERFLQCIACSEKILAEYKVRGIDFLINVFDESAKYLEDLTGITEMMEKDPLVIEFDDDVDFSE